ncbi:hypothetical protein P6U16_21545 (plasmid) [Rhizobium sp. 32-5/1]|uniref:hypothetical protein n=1 Tax=Rhizobium sp. 32-5/1 TaxID=3019602 RepID=UPI00240CF1BA|nr:hypothetical protein [Rhizobium sp. 32-5/1]WEZ85668.1 hypothetical protein P6U16_21545 [Rhizobium sp. 32-5/1]
MQNGGKITGKIDEIDEYFKDPIDTNETGEGKPVASQNSNDEHREELRRLFALVAHLRDQVRERQSQPDTNNKPHRNGSGLAMISTVLFAAGLVGAFLTLQTGALRRR